MKIREGWSSAGWYAVCALLCVHACPMRERDSERESGLFDTRSTDGYGFEKKVSASKLSELIGESLEEFEEKSPSTMRAIVTRTREDPVLLPLILEPEAEMLPAGYKGVKPPGVSHMELRLQKPRDNSPGPYESVLRGSMMDDDESESSERRYAASKRGTQIATDEQNGLIFETVPKGDSRKQRKKAKAFDARKGHSRNENRARNDKADVARRKGATYGAGDGRRKAHNAAGYRGVYHEDEFEKDFRDNGGRTGRFEGHGRYGERRVAAGMYAKGKKDDSGSIEVEVDERGKFEKTKSEDGEGYAAAAGSSVTWTDS